MMMDFKEFTERMETFQKEVLQDTEKLTEWIQEQYTEEELETWTKVYSTIRKCEGNEEANELAKVFLYGTKATIEIEGKADFSYVLALTIYSQMKSASSKDKTKETKDYIF